MQSSMVVAGMDALSESCENILTRRANQRHYSILAQFVKRPWPCPTAGCSARLQAKNPYPQLKLHRFATASDRLRVAEPRALRWTCPTITMTVHSIGPALLQRQNEMDRRVKCTVTVTP